MPDKTFQIKQALLAIEMSDTDEAMVRYYNFLAPKLHISKTEVLHVLPAYEPFLPFPDEMVPVDTLQAEEEEKAEALRQLKGAVADFMPDIPPEQVHYHIEKGNPLKELLEKAADINTELIVIGQEVKTSHHDILDRNLARYADCHALVVPMTTKMQLSHILVPVDFSENSIRALQAALSIRESTGGNARITVLNVYARPNLMSFKLDKTPKQMEAIIEQNHEEGMAKFIAEHAPGYQEVIQTALIQRDMPGVAHHLAEFAEKESADLIVIGAKGHSRVEVLFLGSVTEKLLDHNETIPTLIVR